MFDLEATPETTVTERLAAVGYAPAVAAKFFAEGKYSRAVEICKEALADDTKLVSVRLIYAKALYHAGQRESAAEQFYAVLSLDPENLVALKYLGDIKFAEGDQYTALAHYRRVLEIDPGCRELWCAVKTRVSTVSVAKANGQDDAGEGSQDATEKAAATDETDLTVSEVTGGEGQTAAEKDKSVIGSRAASGDTEVTRTVTLKRAGETGESKRSERLREIPFITETMGDLYLSQGHYRLAAEVFRTLHDRNPAQRLQDKLDQAEKRTSVKDK